MAGYVDFRGYVRYTPSWWVILGVDDALGKYLRHMFWLRTHKAIKLGRPSQNLHVTVISGEQPPIDKVLEWGRYEGTDLWCRLYYQAATNGNAWWMPVYCEAAYNLRERLGLRRVPEPDLHLCIGYEREGTDYGAVNVLEE